MKEELKLADSRKVAVISDFCVYMKETYYDRYGEAKSYI